MIKWLLVVVLLLLAGVGGYLYMLQPGDQVGKVPGNEQDYEVEPYEGEPRVVVDSKVSNYSVRLVDEVDLIERLRQDGFWETDQLIAYPINAKTTAKEVVVRVLPLTDELLQAGGGTREGPDGEPMYAIGVKLQNRTLLLTIGLSEYTLSNNRSDVLDEAFWLGVHTVLYPADSGVSKLDFLDTQLRKGQVMAITNL